MDEAGRLISELQQKLMQLDHKVWLYRQDMAAEFKKHADRLLHDVPKEISDTVNKAIAESLKHYPSLDIPSHDVDQLSGRAVNNETLSNCVSEKIDTPSKLIAIPAGLSDSPDSPSDGRPTSHEREQEFQGIFTPGYLPLLDSTDRNERRSSSSSTSPSVSEKKSIDIVLPHKAAEDANAQSSSYPTSTSSPLQKPPPPRRRSTDDVSNKSDNSDTPVRRSALRRTSSSSKPHSPRHVRFEFAGEEYLPTSSPKLEIPAIDFTPRSPIILGMGGTEELTNEPGSPQVNDRSESPPPKRITSSQALRLLSRGPFEDDGTQWTEVIAPSDGSASVSREEAPEDSDDESLSMPLSVTAAAAKLNGHKNVDVKASQKSSSDATGLPVQTVSASPKEHDATSNGNKTPDEIAEEEDILAEMTPLMPVVANTNPSTKSPIAPLQESAQMVPDEATRGKKKPWFILPDGTDLNDFQGTMADLDMDLDEEDMFAFDETADRPKEKPPSEPDSDDDSPGSPAEDKVEEEGSSISKFATSPARVIPQPGTPVAESNIAAPSGSHRSSYHPFNTPIVNPALHEQAASLGHVPSFVGSVKDGLEEMALQSFRGGGSLAGGAPRSLSERMAFEEAMEARHAATKKD